MDPDENTFAISGRVWAEAEVTKAPTNIEEKDEE